MNKRFPAIVAITLCSTCVALAQHAPAAGAAKSVPDTVSGVVFVDANGNGTLDAGEKPLAGARVTDGVSIVVTGEDGAYTIRIGADPTTPQKGSRVVSLSWPSGTWPTRWWARLDQIADPAKVNFGVQTQEQTLPFAFMHVTDDHGAGWSFKTIAAAATKLKPMLRFAINTGDSAGGHAAALAKNSAAFVVPALSVPGNHDIVGGHGPHRLDQTPTAGNGDYTMHMGPVRWSFDYAGARFVGLDWMDPSIPPHINGSVPRVAADWLEKDLQSVKPGSRIFVFVHFPSGCPKFYQVVAKYKVDHLFGGHNHQHKYYDCNGRPAVTAINFMTGGNLIVVQKDDFTVGEFCLGYKGPDHHSKRCSLSGRKSVVSAVKGRQGQPRTLAAGTLSGASKPVDLGPAASVHIALAIAPGAATKVGLRIGTGPKAVEINWTGDMLSVAGVPVPFGWENHDKKTLLWDLVIDGNRLDFYANKRHHLGKTFSSPLPTGPVTLFSEGAPATIKSAQAWPLKTRSRPTPNRPARLRGCDAGGGVYHSHFS